MKKKKENLTKKEGNFVQPIVMGSLKSLLKKWKQREKRLVELQAEYLEKKDTNIAMFYGGAEKEIQWCSRELKEILNFP